MSSPKRSSPLRPVLQLPQGTIYNLITSGERAFATATDGTVVEFTVQQGVDLRFPIDDPVLGIPGIIDEDKKA